MKKTMTFLKGLIALCVFLLPGMICHAQLYSNTTQWTVYNLTGPPPAGWTSLTVCSDTDSAWVTPTIRTPHPSQTTVIQADIGTSAVPIWSSGGMYSDAYMRAFFNFGPREGCNTDSLIIMADDSSLIWINGHFLGSTSGWSNEGRFIIPESFLRCGCNEIAVEATDVGAAYWWMACKLFQNSTPYATCSPAISMSGNCLTRCFSMAGSCSPCQYVIGWTVYNSCGSTDLGNGCFQFNCPGPVTVQMDVHDDCTGKTEKIYQDFEIDSCSGCNEHAAFTSSGSNPVFFTDASTGSGTITAWYWNFGDGTTSTIQNPVHGYAATGLYNVCLTIIVQDHDGSTCCDQFCKEVQVSDSTDSCLAIAGFTWTSTTLYPYLVNFTNTSVGYQLPCVISWNFDDPGSGASNTSSLLNPYHFFTHAGVFKVCLYMKYCVYDAAGNVITSCDSKICFSVTAGPPLRESHSEVIIDGIMKQNVPNPFTGQTEINYQLPKGQSTAQFIVTDVNGIVVLQRKIETNNGTIDIDASRFAPGIYIYEMRIDGLRIETKRMVVAR